MTGNEGYANVEITGSNFIGTTSVSFNQNSASFSIINNNRIQATVPAGNIYGYIYITGVNNVNARSNSKFKPLVKITSINPLLANEGDDIDINGIDFQAEYLYPYKNGYGVVFQFQRMGEFQITSSTLMEGKAPLDMTSGTIYIIEPDGASTYPTGFFLSKGIVTPTINSMVNTLMYTGYAFYTSIIGEDLDGVTGISLVATTGANANFQIGSNFLGKDYYGEKIDVLGYKNLIPTGMYNVAAISPVDKIGWAPTRYRIMAISGTLY